MCGRISHVALKVVSFCTSLESTFDRNILIALFSWWQFCISYWEKSSNSGNTEPSVFNNIMRHSLRTGNHSWFCRICLLYKCWLGFYQFFFFFILEKEREREICMSRNIKYLKIKKSWRKIDTSLLSRCLKTWIERALRKSSFIDVCSANIYKSSKDLRNASIKNGLCHHISLTT